MADKSQSHDERRVLPMKTRVPAVAGWLSIDPQKPRLLGTKCKKCGCVFFPRETVRCQNPACDGRAFAEHELSPRGKVWSYTNAGYQPPEPFKPRHTPFKPFALAAVELAAEKIVILGQVVEDVDVAELKVGMEMELVLDTLLEDETTETITWKWKPVGANQGGKF
jgi:uncharacterized OB-fold protein